MKNAVFLVVGLTALTGYAHSQSTAADFQIEVVVKDEMVSLTCEQGCAWQEMTFTLGLYRQQGVDAYGMTKGKEETATSDSPFHFALRRENGQLVFDNLKGAAWVSLQAGCNKHCRLHLDSEGIKSY
ncbi:MAG: hypothetical protein R2795_20375 [Saprospiraceae bacterium]